jgi:hypothetical protein
MPTEVIPMGHAALPMAVKMYASLALTNSPSWHALRAHTMRNASTV